MKFNHLDSKTLEELNELAKEYKKLSKPVGPGWGVDQWEDEAFAEHYNDLYKKVLYKIKVYQDNNISN